MAGRELASGAPSAPRRQTNAYSCPHLKAGNKFGLILRGIPGSENLLASPPDKTQSL